MNIDDLTVNFKHLNSERLLEDWHWLIGKDKLPILITEIGDAFLQKINGEEIYHLSVGTGTIRKMCDSVSEFKSLLKDPQFIYDEFVPHVISSFRESGMTLGDDEVYSFKKLPIFGGEGSIDNINPCNIEVHFSIFGQMVEQTQGMEPGTPVGSIDICIPTKKPWWKFWG